jgi:lipoprotein-anchoring transpeptidase ErfK/SrfK
MKPIYAGSYPSRSRGRWKVVFFIVVLLQLIAVGAYLFVSRKDNNAGTEKTPENLPPVGIPAPAPLDAVPVTVSSDTPSPQSKALVADAKAAIAGGQLLDAKNTLDKATLSNHDAEAIKLLGDVNMQLLKSPLMMPGKEYYVIQSGDYLQKIAKKFNTTVALLKAMNGLKTDTIRLGDRMLVYNSSFSIRVSKRRNELDLLVNGKLFKRYSVGTGKFGKTPAVQFTIVDKIVEPPWTRPSDNRQIEYGDPENVLGTRWMAIKSDDNPQLTGFGIHGTWERDSIGQQSSAGCVRMLNEDVEELFDLVPRKTSVIISE